MQPDLPNAALADPDFRHDLKEPSTGWPMLDMITMFALTWYETQMWRVAKGKPTDAGASQKLAALRVLVKTFIRPKGKLRSSG